MTEDILALKKLLEEAKQWRIALGETLEAQLSAVELTRDLHERALKLEQDIMQRLIVEASKQQGDAQ